MAIGERTPLALIDAPASGRMAVGEALTNIAAAGIARLGDVKLSANWMAAAGHPGEDAALYDTVRAVGARSVHRARRLDSRRQGFDVDAHDVARRRRRASAVTAPVSLIVSAFAPVPDARACLTPLLRFDRGDTALRASRPRRGRRRLGGSALAQVLRPARQRRAGRRRSARGSRAFFALVQQLHADGTLLAYHDIGDGGLFVTLRRWRSRRAAGSTSTLDAARATCSPRSSPRSSARWCRCGAATRDAVAMRRATRGPRARTCIGTPDRAAIACASAQRRRVVLDESRVDLHRAWSATTHAMQRLRDNPRCADQEYARCVDDADPGLVAAC